MRLVQVIKDTLSPDVVVCYLAVPAIMNQRNIHRQSTVNKLLLKHGTITPRVTRHVARFLGLRNQYKLKVLVRLKHGLEAEKRGVDSPSQGGSSDQFDLGVIGETFSQLGALLFAELREFWIGENVVGSCEIVVALW